MSKSKTHITTLTPEIINRYQKSQLSEEERYEVEKLLLQSPFDAEAMEGFEAYDGDMLTDLQQLNASIEQRINEEKSDLTFFWLKIAASVLILALSTYLIWDISDDSTIEQIAQSEEDTLIPKKELKEDENVVVVDTAVIKSEELISMIEEKNAISTENEIVENVKIEQKGLSGHKEAEPVIAEVSEVEVADDMILEEVAIVDYEEPKMDALKLAEEVAVEQEGPTRSRISEIASSSVMSKKSSKKRKVKGRVTSAVDGASLPGVNIVVKGTTQGAVADINGEFEIDSIDPNQNLLVASFIGMETKEVRIDLDSNLNIAMESSIGELSEVVVKGYGVGSVEPNYISANPVIGMRSYKKYLDESIQYPENASSKRGKVVITFDVEIDGALTNFQLKKRLGEWQDKEAMRLIKEGSAWRPAEKSGNQIRSSAKVTIKFSKR